MGKYLCLESSTSAPAQIVKNLWVRHEYVQGIQEADSGQWILCNIQTFLCCWWKEHQQDQEEEMLLSSTASENEILFYPRKPSLQLLGFLPG